MGARTGRSRLRQALSSPRAAFLQSGGQEDWDRASITCSRSAWDVRRRPRPAVGIFASWPGYHRASPPTQCRRGVTQLPPGRLSFAGASIRESGFPVSDREALSSHPGNGPVFVVYSRSVGDGGQRSCTQSASPVRRASCSGSIVRPQALQFCLGVGKVIFNRQPVTFVAAGCASDLVPMRSSLAEA
jgi:hypothetical protein